MVMNLVAFTGVFSSFGAADTNDKLAVSTSFTVLLLFLRRIRFHAVSAAPCPAFDQRGLPMIDRSSV
jgi:hypothetical protein